MSEPTCGSHAARPAPDFASLIRPTSAIRVAVARALRARMQIVGGENSGQRKGAQSCRELSPLVPEVFGAAPHAFPPQRRAPRLTCTLARQRERPR